MVKFERPLNTDIKRTAAFSGHRVLKMPENYGLFPFPGPEPAAVSGMEEFFTGSHDVQVCRSVYAGLERAIEKLYAGEYDTFLCGMAMGFDLFAGMAVVEAIRNRPDINLVPVIPYPGQNRMFDRRSRELYERIIAASAPSITTSTCYSRDCFHRRNDYLVANSSTLVCYFDGTKGGTEYTVKKAHGKGLDIINIFR